eukprot:159820-Chlamydomonas_euryale.AAC.12
MFKAATTVDKSAPSLIPSHTCPPQSRAVMGPRPLMGSAPAVRAFATLRSLGTATGAQLHAVNSGVANASLPEKCDHVPCKRPYLVPLHAWYAASATPEATARHALLIRRPTIPPAPSL